MAHPKKLAVWDPDRSGFLYLDRDTQLDHRSNAGREEYGDSGFTGSVAIRHLGGPHQGERAIFRWDDHLDRFEATAAANALVKRLPCSRKMLTQVVMDLVAMNDEPYIRCVVGSGGGTSVYRRGFPPRLIVRTQDIDPVSRNYLGPDVCANGLRVLVTNWRRGYPDAVTLAKSASNYQRSINAKDEAVEQGYDEAVLVDHTGQYLSEVSVANLIVIKGKRAFRPDRQCGALDSITRRTAEMLLRDLEGIITDPAMIGPRLIENADEIMACGTAVGNIRVRELVWPAKNIEWTLGRPDDQQVALRIDHAYTNLIQGLVPGYDPFFTVVESTIRPKINI